LRKKKGTAQTKTNKRVGYRGERALIPAEEGRIKKKEEETSKPND